MAKSQNSQLELIKIILDHSYIDNTGFLYEKDVANNGAIFEMKRNIICHYGIDFLLFRYDPNKVKLFPYFKETSGLKKICDYILFAEEGKYLYLLLIELKKGTESATKQLNASELFVKFLIDSGKRIDLQFTEHIIIKKIRVSEERARRRNRGTKIKKLEPDENGVINYDHSEVFRLKEILDT